MNQHDYHVMTHSRTYNTHEHDTYTDSYIARQPQIRLVAMLLQKIQTEEQKFIWMLLILFDIM